MPVIKGPILRLLAAMLGGGVALALLFGALPPAAPSLSPIPAAVLAQGPIVMDGVASAGEWDGQQLITHPLNVQITLGHTCNSLPADGTHPTDPPCYAHTGYDVVGLWGLYQIPDDSWYFRMDLDGVVGDVDSVQGTAGSLGSGTSGDDGGLLMPFGSDAFGLGTEERYALFFGASAVSLPDRAEITNAPAGPGVSIPLAAPSTVTGEAIYSTTVPGVLEWRVDRASLLPTGAVQPELWLGAEAGASNDRVSEDGTLAFLVLGIDITNICPTPFVVGDPATFDIDYTIVPTGTYPVATNVVITAPVPAGTTYSGCTGGSCSESGGLITWSLGTLPKGTTGTVSFQAVPNVTGGITTDAIITIAEGLRDETTAAGCIALAPTATPIPPTEPRPDKKDKETPVPAPPTLTPTPTPVLTPTPTPAAPVTLPETGAPDGAADLVGLLLLLAGGLLAGVGIRRGWHKGRAS